MKLGIQMTGSNQKLPKFGFHIHTTALWPIEQSSILSAKMIVQWPTRIVHFSATVHD